MKIKQLVEKLKDEMPEGLDELETLRYIYIYIGKNKRFDPVYYFGNRKEREKIYMLSHKNMYNEEFLTGKRELICTSISSSLKLVSKEFGIEVEVLKDEVGIGAHAHNIARLKDGRVICMDLQQDLKYIHMNEKTKNFGIGWSFYTPIPDSDLEVIDKKVNYEYEKEDQMSELIAKIRTMKKKHAFRYLLENPYFNEKIKNEDGYMEAFSYAISVINQTGIKSYAKIVNCYRDENTNKEPLEKRQYSMLIYANDDNDFPMYIFKKKEGKFVPISIERLKSLIAQGMKLVDDMHLTKLKRYMNKNDEELSKDI